MRKKIFYIQIFIGVLLCSASVFGQEEKSLLRDGNKDYKAEDMNAAAQKYAEALEKAPSYGKASYNLGAAYYKMQQLGEAAKQFEVAAADAIDKDTKSDAYHNVGNCFLNMGMALKQNPPSPTDSIQPPSPQQMFQASIEAYKKALRLDPKDEESRYNLAYAKKMLDQEGGGGGQDQQQDQKQDQQKDQQKDQEKKEGDKGEDGKENPKDEGKDKDQKQEKPEEGEMSKEEAERMLKALDQQEKDLQEELAKERIQKGKPIKIDKDW
jgi:Ca-activated chloride channel homolog